MNDDDGFDMFEWYDLQYVSVYVVCFNAQQVICLHLRVCVRSYLCVHVARAQLILSDDGCDE